MEDDNKLKPGDAPEEDEEEKKDGEEENGKEEQVNPDSGKITGAGLEGLQEGIVSGVSKDEFAKEIKDSFLDYAVSTLTSRSVPDARDGMKPVQRRIIFDMYNMGVMPDKPFKKSARIVGDVMGKYHPHGDSAIYLAMCRLAQHFAMRYPLVQGHGNFGSPDGDEPAASRYTEARLAKISLEMCRDIEKGTVPFADTYDSEGQEPTVLPSRFPNLLCNETSGIAVGMATSIPPHNLVETVSAVEEIIKNPELDTLGLMNIIKGPDFPGGGIIMGRSGIRHYFETGKGSVKVRAKYHVDDKGNHSEIVFTELPYMVNKRELAKHIAELSDNKTIQGIAAVADYSSERMGTHFVVTLKKGAIVDIVLNRLFHYTSLQSNFAVNMLALDNGTPKVLSMRQALDIYIKFQEEIITKRTQYNLKKATDRIHILDGIIAITDAIDEAIHIIRSSSNNEEATRRLEERFHLDDIQCKAILDMTLRKLTGLEYQKYVDEKTGLEKDCEKYNQILADRKVLEETLIQELEEIKNKFGDARRTEISDVDYDESDEDMIPNKEILIILTKSGYIKRVDPSEFRLQNRGGIGVKGMDTKTDDEVEILRHSMTKTDVLFFTNTGRVYHCRGYQIQEGSRTSKGIPAVNFLQLQEGEKINSIISMDDYGENSYLFFATKKGVVKRTLAKEFESIYSAGKIAISLREGDELLDVKNTNGNAIVSLGSTEGLVCSFKEDCVRSMGRTASGVKGMDLDDKSNIVGVVTSVEGSKIFSLSENGYGKITDGTEYRLTNRGGKGVRTIKESDKNGALILIRTVHGDEDIIIITNLGTTLRTSLTQINETSRNTIGVKVMTLRDKETISSCSILPSASEYEVTKPAVEETVSDALKEEEKEDDDKAMKELLSRAQNENPGDDGE